MNSPSYDQLWSIIQQYRVAVAVTLNSGGLLETTHVQCLLADGRRNVWFLVEAMSPLVETLTAYPEVCVVCSDSQNYEIASLSGTGVLVTDEIARHVIWVLMDKPDMLYFQRMVLVQFAIEYAECRDTVSNRIMQFTGIQLVPPPVLPELTPEFEFDYIHDVRESHFSSVEH